MKYSIELARLIAVLLISFTHTEHAELSGVWQAVFEIIPTYGTVLLSVISGYLYITISAQRAPLMGRKIKSLLIPYLIANASIVLISLGLYSTLGINLLDRLPMDYTLITEGILALHSPPINPPTYFIRDIFVVFLLVDLVRHRNYLTLIILVPLAVFGDLLLRYDLLYLFLAGAAYGYIVQRIIDDKLAVSKNALDLSIALVAIASMIICICVDPYHGRYATAVLLFVAILRVRVYMPPVAALSYLVHLYHAPVIVLFVYLSGMADITSPILILAQVAVSITLISLLYLITRRIPALRILSGGR